MRRCEKKITLPCFRSFCTMNERVYRNLGWSGSLLPTYRLYACISVGSTYPGAPSTVSMYIALVKTYSELLYAVYWKYVHTAGVHTYSGTYQGPIIFTYWSVVRTVLYVVTSPHWFSLLMAF
jgi:hypothetical protein